MHAYSRRLSAIVVTVCLLLLPMLVQAQTQRKEKPVAWLALRNYQRFDQRLREFATMAKTPALADMLLGMVQLQLAGLGGLDRQRPLSLALTTLDFSGMPPVVLALPYTAQEELLSTLRKFFPNVQEHKGLLQFQGGPMPAFGRLDSAAKTLLLAGEPEILGSLDATLPGDLFASADGEPDLVLRLDAEIVKTREKVMWQQLLETIEQGRQELLQQMEAQLAARPEDKPSLDLLKAYVSVLERALRQTLHDLTRGESRLTLAPSGWVFEVETQMQSGSEAAAFLNQQLGRTSRAAALWSTNAFLRMVQHVRITPALRQEVTTLLPLMARAVSAQLSAETNLTPEQRVVLEEGIKLYVRLAEQWLAQPQYEAAVEMHLQESTPFAMTGWSPLPNAAQFMTQILDTATKILPIVANNAKVEQNVAQHRGTAFHQITWPALKAADTMPMPTTMFLTAQNDMLLWHIGPSPEPLKALVERVQTATAQAPKPTEALARMELSLVRLAQFKLVKEHVEDPFASMLLEQLRQAPDEPLVFEMLVRQNATIVRDIFPGSLIQIVAEAAGKHIMHELMPGKQPPQKPQTPAEKPPQKPQGKARDKRQQ